MFGFRKRLENIEDILWVQQLNKDIIELGVVVSYHPRGNYFMIDDWYDFFNRDEVINFINGVIHGRNVQKEKGCDCKTKAKTKK